VIFGVSTGQVLYLIDTKCISASPHFLSTCPSNDR
jgi:hypothetical protein